VGEGESGEGLGVFSKAGGDNKAWAGEWPSNTHRWGPGPFSCRGDTHKGGFRVKSYGRLQKKKALQVDYKGLGCGYDCKRYFLGVERVGVGGCVGRGGTTA